MDPVGYAEQATLGALLLDPAGLRRLAGLLEPADFFRPAHEAIYRAMLECDQAELTPDLAGVDTARQAELLRAYSNEILARVHVRDVDAVYLHTLMQTAPYPSRAPVYARMVMEASTMRVVAVHALQLAQAARESPELASTLRQADEMSRVLTTLATRWGMSVQGPSDTALGESAGGADGWVAGPPQLEPEPLPPEPDAVAREDQLLASLLYDPSQLEQVRTHLHPEDLTGAGRDELYRAMLDLADRGEPVDSITVMWEVQRRGALDAGQYAAVTAQRVSESPARLTATDVLRLSAEGVALGALPLVRDVLEHSIRLTARRVSRDIYRQAREPGTVARDLITTASRGLARLTTQRSRWATPTRAGPGSSAPRPRPAATPQIR